MTDFEVTDHGSVWLLRAVTSAAQDHAAEVFDGIATYAGFVVVEPRYVAGVCDALFQDGFTVEGVRVAEGVR